MLGMSQHELAMRVGMRREKINRIESKCEDMSLDQFCRLLDAVGLELSVSAKQPSRASSKQRQPVSAHDLEPASFDQAALIDGAEARIVDWGKVPK